MADIEAIRASGLEVAVLDMAGTTVEENGTVGAAVDHAMSSVGVPMDADRLRGLRGMPKNVMFEQLLPDRVQAQEAYGVFVRTLLDSVRAGQMSAKPGVENVLGVLREAGIGVALITGFARDLREAILVELGWTDLVDLALSPEDVGRGRPYPDLIWAAASGLRATGVQSIMVAGDTQHDLLAAHRSGAAIALGVLDGAHSREELQQVPHTALIDTIADLLHPIALA